MISVALDRLEPIGLAILLVAVLLPASPPTATAFSDPSAYLNIWSLRFGPANPFEILIGAFAIGWLARSLLVPSRTSSFDRPLLVLVLFLLALQALSLPQHLDDALYVQADIERIALLAAGYAIATRCIRDARSLQRFTIALAAVICIAAAALVLGYGVTGQTNFHTILGRKALLITEDTLLLLLPVVLAWGALVDGRLTLWGSIGAALLTAVVIAIDLLSLRRGAVLIIGAGVLVRSLGIGGRRLMVTAGALLVVAAIAVAVGPGRPLFEQARYTASSSLLRSSDASSSQRQAEIKNFGQNVDGIDWVIGRGVGVLWRAKVASPVDIASFGSEETALTRLGWHVYGLDWAYKFGLLGIGAILAAAILLGQRLRRAYVSSPLSGRWLTYSLAVCAPPFVLLALTNQRLAIVAGVTVGLLSRSCDLLPRSEPSRDAVA